MTIIFPVKHVHSKNNVVSYTRRMGYANKTRSCKFGAEERTWGTVIGLLGLHACWYALLLGNIGVEECILLSNWRRRGGIIVRCI